MPNPPPLSPAGREMCCRGLHGTEIGGSPCACHWQDNEGKSEIHVEYEGKDHKFAPEEVSAMVLGVCAVLCLGSSTPSPPSAMWSGQPEKNVSEAGCSSHRSTRRGRCLHPVRPQAPVMLGRRADKQRGCILCKTDLGGGGGGGLEPLSSISRDQGSF